MSQIMKNKKYKISIYILICMSKHVVDKQKSVCEVCVCVFEVHVCMYEVCEYEKSVCEVCEIFVCVKSM